MCVLMAALMAVSCERSVDQINGQPDEEDMISVRLDEVAEVLAMVPIREEQMGEVHDAVTASSGNGYDEEYTMKDLFTVPGSGVGDSPTKSGKTYETPLRTLIGEQARSMASTKSLSMHEEKLNSKSHTELMKLVFFTFGSLKRRQERHFLEAKTSKKR